MPVLLLERDPFLEDNITPEFQDRLNSNIRRPLSGVVPKQNSWASISVTQVDPQGSSGQPLSLIDSSAPGGFSNANHNFCVQRVSYQLTEKAQIIETFGDHYVFFYGTKPTVLSVAGYLLNTDDFSWKREWISNWNEHLRGTKCVQRRARVTLTYDETVMEGYMLSTNIDQSADIPYLCPFGFQMLVTNVADIATPLVTKAEDARRNVATTQLFGDLAPLSASATEYHGAPKSEATYFYNDATGVVETRAAVATTGLNGVASTQSGGQVNPDTATWATDPNATRRQWDTPQEAQLALDRAIVGSQNSSRVTRAALASGRAGFPLSTRSDSHTRLQNALGARMAGAALIIPDAPDLG